METSSLCVCICLLSLTKAEVMCVLCKHRVTLLCVYVKCGPHAHTHVCARTKSTSGTRHVRTVSKCLPAHTSTDDVGKHTQRQDGSMNINVRRRSSLCCIFNSIFFNIFNISYLVPFVPENILFNNFSSTKRPCILIGHGGDSG